MPILKQMISDAKNMVVLSGAGLSTESGIPDFRSPGGIWETFKIVRFHSFMAFEKDRMEDWRWQFYMEDQLENIEPNIGHRVITDWVKTGKCSKVITQNIDGLHQKAGVIKDAIIEIHGSARHANCTGCGLRHEMDECKKSGLSNSTNRLFIFTFCGLSKRTLSLLTESPTFPEC